MSTAGVCLLTNWCLTIAAVLPLLVRSGLRSAVWLRLGPRLLDPRWARRFGARGLGRFGRF
ncbi:MAG: hypothetical protein KF699_08185 [Phycisphaeraceae bacterium]|nr:hypothetical protein [Phycisphaeraceae bacterium]